VPDEPGRRLDSAAPFIFDGLVIARWGRPFFERLRRAGIGGVHATVSVWEGMAGTIANLERWRRWFEENDDLIQGARDVADIRAAHARGRTAVVLGLQNSDALEGNLERAETLYELGIRVVQLTYNNQNHVGGSCYESVDSGVTRFGREVIREFGRLGVLIDLSHVGDRTTRDAIGLAEGPVAITHANPRWFRDVPRNKPPDILRALVDRGGILGLCVYPKMLATAGVGDGPCSLDAFCDMAARVVDELGIEHVALGTDFTTGHPLAFYEWLLSGTWTRGPSITELPELPDWAQGPEHLPGILGALRARGFSDGEVRAIAGENWLRLLEAVGSHRA
jgi:membrane dipeptidase